MLDLDRRGLMIDRLQSCHRQIDLHSADATSPGRTYTRLQPSYDSRPMDDDSQARVADYLDDKLQTSADLDSLDALLATVTAQHGLLKHQLDAAQRDLHQAQHAAHAHDARLAQRAHAFRRAQADIDRRLMVIAASETSDDALPRLEAVLATLHRLDVARGYVELLSEVHVLR